VRLVISRHNIDRLEDLATYLKEGIGSRERNIREIQLRRDQGRQPDESVELSEDARWAAELRGEINAFAKVLQILDEQLNIK
jgi:hypothetical protein